MSSTSTATSFFLRSSLLTRRRVRTNCYETISPSPWHLRCSRRFQHRQYCCSSVFGPCGNNVASDYNNRDKKRVHKNVKMHHDSISLSSEFFCSTWSATQSMLPLSRSLLFRIMDQQQKLYFSSSPPKRNNDPNPSSPDFFASVNGDDVNNHETEEDVTGAHHIYNVDDDDDNYDDEGRSNQFYSNKPFYNLLYFPSRNIARGGYQPPKDILLIQHNLLKDSPYRNKTLRKPFEKLIKKHNKLAQFREMIRQRDNKADKKGNTTTASDDGGSSSSSRSSSSFHRPKSGSIEAERLEKKERDVRLIHYGPQETLAQIHHRLMPNYNVVKRVLRETRSVVGTIANPYKPRRILDYGIGCGSSSAAALHVVGVPYVEWIHGVDVSKSQREASTKLLEDIIQEHYNPSNAEDDDDETDEDDDDEEENDSKMSNNRNGMSSHNNVRSSSMTRITTSETLSATSFDQNRRRHRFSRKEQQERPQGEGAGSFDLVLCCYTLHEFKHSAAALAAVAALWEKLAPNGILVVVEPGTPDGFHTVRSVRSMLLQCCPPVSTYPSSSNNEDHEEEDYDEEEQYQQVPTEECHVIAPCTHNGTCPMERYSSSSSFLMGDSELYRRAMEQQQRREEGDDDDDDYEDIEWDGEDFDAENHPDWVEEDISIGNKERNAKEMAKLEDQQQSLDDNSSSSLMKIDDDEEEKEYYESSMITKPDDATLEDFTNMPKYMSNITQRVQETAYCSFIQNLHGSSTSGAGGGERKKEKFSYLVVQKRIVGGEGTSTSSATHASSTDDSEDDKNKQQEPESPFHDVSLADLLARSLNNKQCMDGRRTTRGQQLRQQQQQQELFEEALNLEKQFMDSEADDCGWELAQGPNVSSFGRIIRAPLKNKGHIYVDFCTSSSDENVLNYDYNDEQQSELGKGTKGRILRHRITKAMSDQAPGIYHAARKARWGGLWPDLSERLDKDD